MSGFRSCKERKGRSCCLGMSREAKYSRLHSAPPLSPPCTPGPSCLWSQQAPPLQPAACLPPSLSPPGQPPPSPSPPPGPRAEPQQGQRVSGAGQAGLLLSGEPGGVGSGQAAERPGARAEPLGQAQAVWQSLQVSWGAALWGARPQGLGVGEPGGGARGLRQTHVCIWQSARSQLSEAGPLASSRGGRQGPGDTPPPKTHWCPLPFPSCLSLWMTQTLLSHLLRVLGPML